MVQRLVKIHKEITESYNMFDISTRSLKGKYEAEIIDILMDIRKVILIEYFGSKDLSLNKLCDLQKKVQFIMQIKKDRQLARNDSFNFVEKLPTIRNSILEDIESAFLKDPAADSREEIAIAYPGIFAILVYRISHELYRMGYNLIARLVSEYAHSKTGIDIHPGANIGRNFFMDHGTGIVIGETTEIGNNVTIYQGVTLGAFSFDHDENGEIIRRTKRHPTIEDDVTIYAGATILGGETVVGGGSIIGGNVWLTKSVLPNSKVLYKFNNKILT
ncbi:MAG: serine acetyltransferase [Bacillus sp. (in: Bacteria)]|nr:serine acetyltransferase [Bacillus sp. (in: firmicutes)]